MSIPLGQVTVPWFLPHELYPFQRTQFARTSYMDTHCPREADIWPEEGLLDNFPWILLIRVTERKKKKKSWNSLFLCLCPQETIHHSLLLGASESPWLQDFPKISFITFSLIPWLSCNLTIKYLFAQMKVSFCCLQSKSPKRYNFSSQLFL